MNPIVDMLNRQNPLMNILRSIQGMQNPMAALEQMAMGDQRIQSMMDTIRKNGSVQQAVYAEAQKRNIDPNALINQAQQMMQGLSMK